MKIIIQIQTTISNEKKNINKSKKNLLHSERKLIVTFRHFDSAATTTHNSACANNTSHNEHDSNNNDNNSGNDETHTQTHTHTHTSWRIARCNGVGSLFALATKHARLSIFHQHRRTVHVKHTDRATVGTVHTPQPPNKYTHTYTQQCVSRAHTLIHQHGWSHTRTNLTFFLDRFARILLIYRHSVQ